MIPPGLRSIGAILALIVARASARQGVSQVERGEDFHGVNEVGGDRARAVEVSADGARVPVGEDGDGPLGPV